MVNENASLVKYEPPKCDECGRKIVVLSDLCAKCAAGIELNDKKQAEPVQPDFSDAYQGAREDAEIWKKRALEAEELNRKFIAQINDETFMGEPAPPVQPAGAQEPVLQRVMGRLADLLDEDQFAEIEGIVVSAGIAPPPPAAAINEQLLEALKKIVECDANGFPVRTFQQREEIAKAAITAAETTKKRGCVMARKDGSVKEAVYAYSNLNTFAVIVSILENGHLSGPQSQSAERIIAICQKEMQRQLKLYDAALDKSEKARGRG